MPRLIPGVVVPVLVIGSLFLGESPSVGQGRTYVNDDLGLVLATPKGWRLVEPRSELGPDSAILVLEPIDVDSATLRVIAVFFVERQWRSPAEPLEELGASEARLRPGRAAEDSPSVPLVIWMSRESGALADDSLTSVSALRVVRTGWLQFVYSMRQGSAKGMRSLLTEILQDCLSISPAHDIRFVLEPG